MDHSSISFQIKRDETGLITGFSLTAVETLAECFCVSYPHAKKLGKANFSFEDGKIIFTHQGIGLDEAQAELSIYGASEGGVYEATISDEDAEQLKKLFRGGGPYEGNTVYVKTELAWGKGFSVESRKPD